MQVDYRLIDAICDRCAANQISTLALEIVEPGIMGSDWRWVEGTTREQKNKWGEAIGEASDRLTTPCVRIVPHSLEEELSLCKNCVKEMMETF